uniref:Uncharacterized protein n=1 Tax=Arundo donax TaxID=35708 RepID=A0A0A8YRZ6_ARUDO
MCHSCKGFFGGQRCYFTIAKHHKI